MYQFIQNSTFYGHGSEQRVNIRVSVYCFPRTCFGQFSCGLFFCYFFCRFFCVCVMILNYFLASLDCKYIQKKKNTFESTCYYCVWIPRHFFRRMYKFAEQKGVFLKVKLKFSRTMFLRFVCHNLISLNLFLRSSFPWLR